MGAHVSEKFIIHEAVSKLRLQFGPDNLYTLQYGMYQWVLYTRKQLPVTAATRVSRTGIVLCYKRKKTCYSEKT